MALWLWGSFCSETTASSSQDRRVLDLGETEVAEAPPLISQRTGKSPEPRLGANARTGTQISWSLLADITATARR